MTEAVTPAVEKKAAFCTKTNDGDTVTWTFSDGTFRSRKVSEYPQELIIALAAHGLSAKGGDSYASAGGDLSFGITALDRVLTNLDAGLFSGPRGSGGPARPESAAGELPVPRADRCRQDRDGAGAGGVPV